MACLSAAALGLWVGGAGPRASPPAMLLERTRLPAKPLTAGPPADKWNEDIRRSWQSAYRSASEADYEIEEVEGRIPRSLSGTLFRNGPGNFERGGDRFQHVLDGDGLVTRFCIDGERGRAHFRSRFVRTPSFEAEAAADKVLFRNTFGTQPDGWLANVGRMAVKNVANTNIKVWGGRAFALWEAGLPCRLNPSTLDFEDFERLNGTLASGFAAMTTGFPAIDSLLGVGQAFTAHPREDMRRGTLVGWSWATHISLGSLDAKIFELDATTGVLRSITEMSLPSPLAPHDFIVTDSWYVFCVNAMKLNPFPFVMGFCGPVEALQTTGEGVVLHLVPRPGGVAEGRRPVTVRTDHSIFAIHHATGFEDPPEADGSQRLTLFTAAWPDVRPGPFLGDWGGAFPIYDDGRIKPTQLMRTTVDIGPPGADGAMETTAVRETVLGGACIDHPHVDPRFDGDSRCRYTYQTWSNGLFDGEGESISGSPPIGWCRYDRITGDAERWVAPAGCFCEEPVIIPKSGCSERVPSDAVDEAQAWLAGMMFDPSRDTSCLAILDCEDIAAGPVCKLWLRQHVPHGLHGCWIEGVSYFDHNDP